MTAVQTAHDVIVAANTVVGSRVSPLRAFQGASYPYAVINETSEQPQNHLTGYGGLDLCEVQVDFWDSTFLGADTAAREGRSAMEAAGYLCLSRVSDLFDGTLDPGSFRVGYVFQVWQ